MVNEIYKMVLEEKNIPWLRKNLIWRFFLTGKKSMKKPRDSSQTTVSILRRRK